jgi:acyl-coenzyme A thioesterase PaaI-like protein
MDDTTGDYRMTTTDAAVRDAVSGDGDTAVLTLDPAFQGLPDTAHGGTVLAVFDAVARWHGAHAVIGHYRKRVPLGAPLPLKIRRTQAAVGFQVLDDSRALLVEGAVIAAAPAGATPTAVVTPPVTGQPLPVSSRCFACGVDNPLGLQARLQFDASAVWTRWQPSTQFRTRDGALASVALTTLLDEAAFWMGALTTGEAGMTTELRVTLHEGVRAEDAITVVGSRASVRARTEDGRYWDTTITAYAGNRMVASATITFVAVRGAARKLVTGMFAMNERDIVARVFPGYTRDQGGRDE